MTTTIQMIKKKRGESWVEFYARQLDLFDTNAQGSFDWDEEKHPRAEDGKFAEKEGGEKPVRSRDRHKQFIAAMIGELDGYDLEPEDLPSVASLDNIFTALKSHRKGGEPTPPPLPEAGDYNNPEKMAERDSKLQEYYDQTDQVARDAQTISARVREYFTDLGIAPPEGLDPDLNRDQLARTEEQKEVRRAIEKERRSGERERLNQEAREFGEKHRKRVPAAHKTPQAKWIAAKILQAIDKMADDSAKFEELQALYDRARNYEDDGFGWGDFETVEKENQQLIKKYSPSWSKRPHFLNSLENSVSAKNRLEERFKEGFWNHMDAPFDFDKQHAKALEKALKLRDPADIDPSVVEPYLYNDWMPEEVRSEYYKAARGEGSATTTDRWKEYTGGEEFQHVQSLMKTAKAEAYEEMADVFTQAEETLAATDLIPFDEYIADAKKEMEEAEAARDEMDKEFNPEGNVSWSIPFEREEEYDRVSSRLLHAAQKHADMSETYKKQRRDLGQKWLKPLMPTSTAQINAPEPEHLNETGRQNWNTAREFLSSVLSSDIGQIDTKIVPIEEDSVYGPYRAYCRADSMHVTPGQSVDTFVHEFGHVVEHRNRNDLGQLSAAFVSDQLMESDEAPVHLGPGYEAIEYGSKDKLIDTYAGKWYGKTSSEIFSMGIEELWRDPVRLYTEAPEQFRFVMAMAHGKF